MEFTLAEQGYKYRPLRLLDPLMKGWDVYALQTGLKTVVNNLAEDGVLGPKTSEAIHALQSVAGLERDGIAGVISQRALALRIGNPLSKSNKLPHGLLKGQVEHESSFWLGNHTAPYDDGERDCGVCQRNTNYATMGEAFDVPASLAALVSKVKSKHDKYLGQGIDDRQAWELAAGSWNAPSWTDRLAAGDRLTKEQLIHIQTYIEDVTAYVKW